MPTTPLGGGASPRPFPVTEDELTAYVEAFLKVAILPLMERLEALERRLDRLERRDPAPDDPAAPLPR